MLLHIDDTMLVTDVQEDFSDSYPLLKIEFYKQQANKGAAPATHRISPEEPIGAIRNLHHPGNLEILSWYSADRVAREFKEKFGLQVQVFREEAGTWVQTESTGSHSLAEQMARARQAIGYSTKKQRAVEYEYLLKNFFDFSNQL